MSEQASVRTMIVAQPELWACSLWPEGMLENWLVPDGSQVEAGEPVARIRIEDALHTLSAPAGGALHIAVKPNGIVEPGTAIGEVTHASRSQNYFEEME